MNHTFELFVLFFITFFLSSTTMVKMKIVPKKSLSSMADFYTLELKMPQVLPKNDDEYLCTAVNISSEEIYIKKFDPNADSNRIHHIIIFGCKNLHRTQLYPNNWHCSHAQLCPGMRVIYAWGRNAPSLQLPQDVGFRVGGGLSSDINFLILQAHYAHPLNEHDSSGVRLLYTIQPQPYVAGIFLLASLNGIIPPHKSQNHVDINCRLNRDPITVFAYRVHAHALGTVVSGYRYSHNRKKWDLIAKGNPQWPQAFYPMDNAMEIDSQDIIAARCTYNSTTRNTLTLMGSTMKRKERRLDMESCEDVEFESEFYRNLPEGNDQPLPRNITMEQSALDQHSAHNHPHHQQSNNIDSRFDVTEGKKIEFFQDLNWPSKNFHFGQITAVDFDSMGNIIIFHRGKHVWNELSFDLENNYRRIQNGPIAKPTIITINTKSQKIIDSWGENLFFMPHGLTVDRQNHSIWLTDVAMHQVFRYSLDKSDVKNYRKAILVLGERFKPGDDDKHFCKPTSVAIDYSNGEFYVADGYCNSRVIRFSSDGRYLNHWGHKPIINDLPFRPSPNSLNVPHKILLIDNNDVDGGEKLACIADRENGRIECFLAPYGQFRFQIHLPQFNGRLFSIAYSKHDDILYAVNGPSLWPPMTDVKSRSPDVMAFAFDFHTQQPLATFAPKLTGTFNEPHDIAVSPTGDEVFVVEIRPNNIWKFTNFRPIESMKQQQQHVVVDSGRLKTLQQQETSSIKNASLDMNMMNLPIKSKIIEKNDQQKNITISNLNFSFELLQIRTKEFREKVWSNNVLYFVLLALFIFIMILNVHHTSSTLRFCSILLSTTVNLLKRKLTFRSSLKNSERIRLSDVLKSSTKKRKSSSRSDNKRYGGFNRLPQNEEESDLVIVTDDDDDDDDNDDSDVLEDFSLSQQKNKNHVI
ncbi:hypothetical protein DERF_003798 [Dermatophagoides farinae]|uniref:Uncharacterized protein n=1 Tax=Dermatophagoides farinae TaxID=6954 RepID=A0A922LCQ5_DERFA|nr:hypothetical protein DERF_003798 [Dermatophagoides farinae]